MRKNVWKRLLAAGLSAGLLLGSLSGCGTSAGESAVISGAENGKEENAANDAAESDNGETQEEMIPLNIPDDKYRTFYEVFVYSFYDSNGDGIGDLKGLTEKLDYINDGDDTTDSDLGCNGIWLMPIMPSTTYHKYDVTDFYDIDKEYGSMEDFDAFLAECKKRDIHVILDLVINHTSSSHPWFYKACDYLKQLEEGEEPNEEECPYIAYYNFSKEKKEGYCEFDGTWYYEARFWKEMPDLNLGNEKVRAEIEDIVDFWLDKGVDGFRLDAAKEYYSGTTQDNIDVLTWFNAMVKEKKEDAYLVAEVWTDIDTYASYYESGIDSVFNFAFADSGGIIANTVKGSTPAEGYGKSLETIQDKFASKNPAYIDAPFYTNHDMGRGAGYYSGDNSERQTKIAGAMNLLMSGCAFLYYGEELGMKGSGKDENKRAPMYWSKDSTKEGMCKGPVDMDAVKMKYDSLEEQSADEKSIYHYYKDAIRLRNTYPEIARGEAQYMEELSDERMCAVKKSYEGSELLLMMNISAEEKQAELSDVSLNGKEAGDVSIGGQLLTGEEAVKQEGTTVTLPPYSILLFQ